MSPHTRPSRAKRSRLRRTTKIRDRSGQPLQVVSTRDVAARTGATLRAASRHGTLAITRGGRPVAVMVSLDEFLAICVDFTMGSIKDRAR